MTPSAPFKLVPAGWNNNGRRVYQTEDKSVTVWAVTYRGRKYVTGGPRVTMLDWVAFECVAPFREIARASTLKTLSVRLEKVLATGAKHPSAHSRPV